MTDPAIVAIGIVVIFASILAIIAKFLKQPCTPAYILAGIIVGPLFLKMVMNQHDIANICGLATFFVMLAIGAEMDADRIKSVGKVVTLGGILQVISVTILGFLISLIWFNVYTSLYLGLMISFASTALVVKIISDKRQLDTLQGGIILGILLLQDIVAIIVLSLLPAKDVSINNLLALALKSFGIVSVGLLSGQYVFPRILRSVFDSSEALTISSVGIGFVFAFLAESQGLSMSIGAFITGVSLANLPYGMELQARLKSIRDFFIPIFFASLGIQIAIPAPNVIAPIIALALACIFLKPLINATITALFGYQSRTSYYVGVSLVPVSEFGLIIIALGINLGHIQQDVMTISVAVMALTMFASSYFLGDGLYERTRSRLKFLNKIGPDAKIETDLTEPSQVFDLVLIGMHRAGRYLYKALANKGFKILVIESSFERVKTLKKRKSPASWAMRPSRKFGRNWAI